ncbi:MAG: hypothetical protein ACI4JJ_01565 [Huintestinicola sp.]
MTQDSSVNINLSEEKAPSAAPKKERFFSKAMLHNGMFNIKDNLRLMVIIFALHFAAAPLVLLMCITTILSTGQQSPDEAYFVIAVLTTIMAVLMGIICAITVFPYLYKKSQVDMRLSLPLTTGQRFVSDYLSGLFIYLVPYLAAEMISYILLLIGHLTCDGKVFYDQGYMEPWAWTCTVFEEITPYFNYLFIGGFFIMLMTFALTVLVITCCGSIFECAAYTIMLNGLIPGTLAVVIYTIMDNIKGMQPESHMINLVSFTSPGGSAFGLCYVLETMFQGIEDAFMTFGGWLAKVIIVTALFIAGSFLLFRKRKAESVGSPFVFRAFYHIIVTAVIVCITFLFFNEDDPELYIPMIVITFIVYMLLDVVAHRGFKKVGWGILRYVGTMLGCLGVFALATATGGFGAASRVPSVSSIDKAYISYTGYFDGNTYIDFAYSGFKNAVCISDDENLQIITDVHRSLAEDDFDIYTVYETFTVFYKLKTGGTVVRSYDMPRQYYDELYKMDMTEEFRAQRAERAVRMVEEAKKNYDSYSDEASVREFGIVTFDPKWQLYRGTGASVDGREYYLSALPDDFVEKFLECYKKDIMNETEEEYYRNESGCGVITFFGSNYYSLSVKESYTETLSYLEACGIDPEIPEVTDELIKAFSANNFSVGMACDAVCEEYFGRELETSSAVNEDSGYELEMGHYVYLHNYTGSKAMMELPEVKELLNVSQKMYKTDESCYTIFVNGNCGVIPSQYSDLAEKVYIRAVVEYFIDYIGRSEYYVGDDYYYTGYNGYDDYTIYDEDENERRVYRSFLRAFLKVYSEEDIMTALEQWPELDLSDPYGRIAAFVNE